MEVKQNSPFLASFSVDVPKTGKASLVAESHPTVAVLRAMFPLAKSNFRLLTEHCQVLSVLM
jgi:CHASE1-domain containing sensor protein